MSPLYKIFEQMKPFPEEVTPKMDCEKVALENFPEFTKNTNAVALFPMNVHA